MDLDDVEETREVITIYIQRQRGRGKGRGGFSSLAFGVRKQSTKKANMIVNKPLVLTYLYLLIYILLSSGVILYNKVTSITITIFLIIIIMQVYQPRILLQFATSLLYYFNAVFSFIFEPRNCSQLATTSFCSSANIWSLTLNS